MLSDQTNIKEDFTMEQNNYTTENKKGQHLKYEDRLKLEALLKAKVRLNEIAKMLGGRSERTLRREIKRGTATLLNSDYTTREEYSADVGQCIHDELGTHKGPSLKIGNNFKLVEFLEEKIAKEKYSPYAALEAAKQESDIEVNICLKSVYNYIDEGLFLNITNKDLPVKKKPKKRDYAHIRTAHTHQGTSISERPKEVETRADFGNWELDTVIGKKKTNAVLLVLTERSLNIEIIRKMKNKSQECVIRELDKLERKLGSVKFRNTFKTITCDNGCENLDAKGMEKSVLTNGMRTKVYYAHPYSSWERGSNECANKLIRRFIPKGADISQFSYNYIKYIEHWINNYPRKMFGGFSSYQLANIIGISL